MGECITSNCTIPEGPETDGEFYVVNYYPTAPVVHWNHHMELATICVANSLTFIVIAGRLWYRRRKLKRFRADDQWMAVAGIFLVAFTVSQIGTSVWGGGLHMVNVPESWLPMHWYYSIGWAGYYVVTTCIKISVCFCFLELLPKFLNTMIYYVYGLCIFIASLGIALTLSWIFECEPVASNFIYSIDSMSCINHDVLRAVWIGLSIVVDINLLLIPLGILRKLKLQEPERRILKLVFSATLLGTATCILEIYGLWDDRIANSLEPNWHETCWVMLNSLEILMYAIGASFPVLSRYFVSRTTGTRTSAANENFSTWDRQIPNFFPTNQRFTEHDEEPYVMRDSHSATISAECSMNETEDGLVKGRKRDTVETIQPSGTVDTVDMRIYDERDLELGGAFSGLGVSNLQAIRRERVGDVERGMSVDVNRMTEGETLPKLPEKKLSEKENMPEEEELSGRKELHASEMVKKQIHKSEAAS